MPRPVVALQQFARKVNDHAKQGSAVYQQFLVSPLFEKYWKPIAAQDKRKAILIMAEAEALVLKRDGLPPPAKPQRRSVSRWHDPLERARLAQAYAKAQGDDHKAALLMGMTVGAVKLAKQRYLGAGATPDARQAA